MPYLHGTSLGSTHVYEQEDKDFLQANSEGNEEVNVAQTSQDMVVKFTLGYPFLRYSVLPLLWWLR